jgi:hypothetical protein
MLAGSKRERDWDLEGAESASAYSSESLKRTTLSSSTSGIQRCLDDPEYKTWKPAWEVDHFYLRETQAFHALTQRSDNSFELSRRMRKESLLDSNVSQPLDFIRAWVRDPERKTYDKTGFYPPGYVAKDFPASVKILNLAPPRFQADEYAHTGVKPNDVGSKLVLDHLLGLCAHDTRVYEYVLNYVAHMVKVPCRDGKGVLIVFSGPKGCGKDTFLDFVGTQVIGAPFYANYKSAAKSAFDKHSEAARNRLLVKFEVGLRSTPDCPSHNLCVQEDNGTFLMKDEGKAMITSTTMPVSLCCDFVC